MSAEPVLAGITDEAAPDLTGQLAVLAELGWSHVELRTVGDRAVTDLDDEFAVAKALAARDVRVSMFVELAEAADVVLLHEICSGWAGTAEPVFVPAGRAMAGLVR